MTSKTYRRRKRRILGALALGLSVAATVVPAALADGRSPDTLDAVAAAQSSSLDGRSADTLDAVSNIQSSFVDGWQAGAQEQGLTISDGRSADTMDAVSSAQISSLDGRSSDTLDAVSNSQSSVLDGRSSDTLDAVSANQSSIGDGRSADTRDAAYVAHEPVVVVHASGFDWADAGIGFGSAFGIALMGLALAFGLRRHGKSGLTIRHMPA
jgi:hypothetical protein